MSARVTVTATATPHRTAANGGVRASRAPARDATLADLEAVIGRGLDTFVEVGLALGAIHERRLYRATHSTFEDYCRERWGMDRTYATPGPATRAWDRRFRVGWKPVIWLVKGHADERWRHDVVRSSAPDKSHHHWGQSESGTSALVRMASAPGELVLDPFVGGGTTAVAAVSLRGRFIGADVDAGAVETTARRLAELENQPRAFGRAGPLPGGPYRCVVADPPWKMDTGPGFGYEGPGHRPLSYPTMSVEEIAALDVQSIAAEDAHLYLWTTSKYLRDAYDIAEAWGFKPSVPLVWAKAPRGLGLGDTYRLTTEFLLFCRRGHPEHKRVEPRSWWDWPRGKHSAKPAAMLQMVESVSPGPYVELFARTRRPGWASWGDEIAPAYDDGAADTAQRRAELEGAA